MPDNPNFDNALSTSEVKAHTRKMKIVMPQRQFMPYEDNSNPVLDNSIKRELENKFISYLTL
jgi:hypothetical protein